MQSSTRQVIYGLLAIAGLVATWTFNLQFMAQHGSFSVGEFIAGGYANPAASSLSSDLTVGVLAFLVWLVAEARRLRMRRAWAYVVVTFGVAFAFAFPLFLLMRERRLAELGAAPA